MTEYGLPEGLTAEKLRIMATTLHEWPYAVASDLSAWADAIDPPKPPSVVTDEMVEAFISEYWRAGRSANITMARDTLEAVERLGWKPPCTTCDGHGRYCPSGIGSDGYDMCPDCTEPQWKVEKLAERLAMAERLLRKVVHDDGDRFWSRAARDITTAEADYLRSLNGEGE